MRAHVQPINRKRIVVVSPKLAGGYFTTRATLRCSFKVKGQGHKPTSSVRLISASVNSGNKMMYLRHYRRAGRGHRGLQCRPNPAATVVVSITLTLVIAVLVELNLFDSTIFLLYTGAQSVLSFRLTIFDYSFLLYISA